jgi:hypothetical protein
MLVEINNSHKLSFPNQSACCFLRVTQYFVDPKQSDFLRLYYPILDMENCDVRDTVSVKSLSFYLLMLTYS